MLMIAGRCGLCGAESTTGGHACAINITAAARAILRPPLITGAHCLTRENAVLRAIAEDAIQHLDALALRGCSSSFGCEHFSPAAIHMCAACAAALFRDQLRACLEDVPK